MTPKNSAAEPTVEMVATLVTVPTMNAFIKLAPPL
jgi:hypothetical protein